MSLYYQSRRSSTYSFNYCSVRESEPEGSLLSLDLAWNKSEFLLGYGGGVVYISKLFCSLF